MALELRRQVGAIFKAGPNSASLMGAARVYLLGGQEAREVQPKGASTPLRLKTVEGKRPSESSRYKYRSKNVSTPLTRWWRKLDLKVNVWS